jgi:hypothetical protein
MKQNWQLWITHYDGIVKRDITCCMTFSMCLNIKKLTVPVLVLIVMKFLSYNTCSIMVTLYLVMNFYA